MATQTPTYQIMSQTDSVPGSARTFALNPIFSLELLFLHDKIKWASHCQMSGLRVPYAGESFLFTPENAKDAWDMRLRKSV
ncbi:predicted protein [Plenodomus lingam JN3]|uniref:Predicted protein n=1 Tax=Leptosphaeria maculans (strain JN3 / isolate v23.1.3 / race Av1-4-5-6-7-8) TaxID=985895 RepID=E5A8S5_LEPMJ|nr:predicted protein [Plenodomus lingam JN3]CBY00020.1 predicted protein [Plenodomus lingam JN3]